MRNAPKFVETARILLKHLRHAEFFAIAAEVLQKRFVCRFFGQKRPSTIHFCKKKYKKKQLSTTGN